MRVISGSAKGRALYAPAGHCSRPTTSAVREALFNILFDVSGFIVLDLFAGTGAVGIEALSRGANSAVFVDNSPESVKIIRKNVEKTGFVQRSAVIQTDAAEALKLLSKKNNQFDLIYIDPPYEQTRFIITELLLNIKEHGLLRSGGVCVVESGKNESAADYESAGFTFIKQRDYPNARLIFLQ